MSEFMTGQSAVERIHGGNVVLARELVDKELIETRAQQLIDSHRSNHFEAMAYEDEFNAVTSVFEEMTAAGDITTLRFAGDQREVHRATINRLLNGHNETMPVWDRHRFFAEICEELSVFEVFLHIESGQLPADTIVVTESDFPDDATSVLEAHSRGYRGGNRKGMVRTFHFEEDENGEYVRVLEQVSRSNSNDGSTREWFNLNAAAVPLHSTGALHEQIITTRRRLPDGVVTIVQELDETLPYKARYGEPILEAIKHKRPDYKYLRRTSEIRRYQLENFTDELKQVESDLLDLLHKGLITYPQKLNMFARKRSEVVDRILLLNINQSYARDARGEPSAKYYELATRARDANDEAGFIRHMESAKHSKDPLAGGNCGGDGGNSEDYLKHLFDAAEDDEGKLKWMKCPNCKNKVYDDPCAKVLFCTDCKALVMFGQKVAKGNGGSKRREEEKEQQKVTTLESKRAAKAAKPEQLKQVGGLALAA